MIESIFRHKAVNFEKLLSYGFKADKNGYSYSTYLMNKQFEMTVKITKSAEVSTKVIDLSTQEPYTLFLLPGACGTFVGGVREEYENILLDIAKKCFYKEVFKSEYAKLIIKYIEEKHKDNPEYLWEKFPDNAIFRRKDNSKWYAALLTVKRRALGFKSDENVEIIDLKGEPEFITALVDGIKYLPGWHMNKKHWFTICLDGTVSIKDIFEKIDSSYELAKKK